MPEGDFDRPVYSGEMFKEQGPSPLESIKPYLGKIILLLIVIGIAYGVYWFFIGSYQEVRITVTGLDSKITGLSGSIIQEGKTIALINSNNQTVKLRQGSYEIELSAEGFKPSRQPLEVNPQKTKINVTLEQDLDVIIPENGLKLLANDAGNTIFAGQNNQATLTLTNNSAGANVEIEAKIDCPNSTITVQPPTIVVPANSQETTAMLTINISEATKIANKTTGDSYTITLRVKGLTQTFERKVFVKSKPKVSISTRNLDLLTIKANNTPSSKQFSLQNNEGIELKGNVLFTVNPESSINQPSEVKKWFTFLPENISSIGKTTLITAIVKIPTAAQPETINGTITASSEIWSDTITFVLKVATPKTIISNPTIDKPTVTVKKGEFVRGGAVLLIKNDSEFTITNIKIKIDPVSCDETFITNLETRSIQELSNEDKHNIARVTMNLTAPMDAESDRTVTCNIQVTYDDPLNLGLQIEDLAPVKVMITPKD